MYLCFGAAISLVIAAGASVEDELGARAGELAFGPQHFDELVGFHTSTRANAEACLRTEFGVHRVPQARDAVRRATGGHHVEDFVSVNFSLLYLHGFKSY